jgi:alpha-glucosidase
MHALRIAQVIQAANGRALFALERGWRCEISLPAEGVGRVLWHPPDGLREPRTWAIAPDSGDEVPWEGRQRTALFDGVQSATVATSDDGVITLGTDMLRAQVRLAPFGVAWQQRLEGQWTTCCADRPTYAYAAAARTARIVHSMARDEHDQYFGLGDKTGALDLHGRRLRTLQLDALGYNGETSDPLYKHWPFFLGRRRDSGACYGLYYDTLSMATFDFGQEFDNYHGFYRSTDIADGDLDFYVYAGPDLAGALGRFVRMTGGTAMPPRWTLGFANTAMGLVDAPDAQARLAEFLARAKQERIPLSAFHFGSGYTSRGKRRYVFTWNRDKFPDPQRATAAFRAEGIKLVANLKPCLLDDHPAFADVRAQGAFVGDAGGAPCLDQFWDGWGAHIDFTHPAGVAWWQHGLTTQVLDYGFDAAWNDNNEFEIWDEDGRSHGFGTPMPISRSRPLHALLMTRASAQAQAARAPGERVYTVTRAGTPGIARYAQTWTGDNTTSWHTLRWNQRMALTMGLSGMFNIGHDIGGFAGPSPDAELLVRWMQACALNPRCIMNSWKDDGSVNTPWLHPEVTGLVRAAIELRLALSPYLYTCVHDAVVDPQPVLRPTFWEFPDDAQCFDDCDEMLVGPSLLVAPVFAAGATTRTLRLPRNDETPGWRCYHTGTWYPSGATITVAAPLDRLPLFVRAGAVLPTTDAVGGTRRTDEPSRALRLFPAPPDAARVARTSAWIEDDGLTDDWKSGAFTRIRCTLDGDGGALRLALARDGAFALPCDRVRIVLPAGETRDVTVDGASLGVPVAR